MQFTIATFAAILAYASAAPSSISKRDLSSSGNSGILPGANVPYACTKETPCGTPKDPNAESTFYNLPMPGIGNSTACGYNDPTAQYTAKQLGDWTNDFIALGVGVMGTLSSGTVMNPVCGRFITVTNLETGLSKTAPVVDKCPGCKSSYGLDMSQKLFSELGGTVDQGVFPISWYWDDSIPNDMTGEVVQEIQTGQNQQNQQNQWNDPTATATTVVPPVVVPTIVPGTPAWKA